LMAKEEEEHEQEEEGKARRVRGGCREGRD
jgi:hypothetical protein